MMTKLDDLIAVANKLRAPGGCPWDAEQDHNSLTKYLLEEAYELIDAIESGNREDILEELGDVLYQVVFHSDLAASGSLGEPFDIQDVAELSAQKMIGRHPHVFGSAEELEKYAAKTGDDVMLNWDAHKQREKPERSSILDGIPQALPALALADKVIGKAEKIGLLDADAPGPFSVTSEAELGAILLAIVSSGKSAGFDSERALRGAVRELQVEIREVELADANDAGVIGLPAEL
ncbi:MazG family protein [Rhodoluna limnophila]|uniref:MazG family protein n=1 Tax=Rhodoluna limnophila TaxID=232537 RepID=UPI0011071D0B|nr:MazG family protein [Rhodoluna limnophila]